MKPSIKRLIFSVVLACAGLLAALLIVEAGMRLFSGTLEKDSTLPTRVSLFDFGNVLAKKLTLMRDSYPKQHDAVLGWVPKAGYSGSDNILSKEINIAANTVRTNGAARPTSGSAILVTGDSFTFGDSVNNNETWPSYLEEILARRVINGGVFGYGLDQSFLRAKSLADEVSPGVIVLGLIPDDIPRMGFSKWYGAEKPYFEISEGLLVLKNQPVPDVPTQLDGLGFVKSVLGHFYTADYLMRRMGKAEWWYADKFKSIPVKNDLHAVSRRIVEGFYELAVRKGCRAAIVVQYTEADITDPRRANRKRIYPTIIHAREKGIPVIDFYPLLKSMPPDQLKTLYQGHMTASGNKFTAKMIAAALASEGVIPNASFLSSDVDFYRQVVSQNTDDLDKLAMAKDNFLRELANDPTNPSRYNTVGVLYLNLGALESAAFYFTKAVTLNPTYAEAVNNLGMVAMSTMHFADAEQFYRKAMELDTKIFEPYYNMACARSLQNDPDGAAMWIEKAIQKGFASREQLENDGDLENARKSGKFMKLIESLPAK
ncbi:MAG: hypothetical protein HZB23_09660 [Deltaproteobacteria bacterium]|nr:hypothetical protein [Deltaproteobacteria bacterium]